MRLEPPDETRGFRLDLLKKRGRALPGVSLEDRYFDRFKEPITECL
ncbi:MAG: hypothetical protein R6V85_11655 [Polyangia bacterium]